MTIEELQRQLAESQQTIRTLEEELAETNRGLVALAMELEQRVDQRTESLRESEDRFRGLAESIPQLVWASDAAGKTVYLNRRWVEYAGHEPATAAERAGLIHPDDLAGVQERWNLALGAGLDFQCEYRFRRHDGQYRWFLARSVIRRDAAGRCAGWVGTATDIHDLKLAQEILRRNAEDLARSNKDLEQFAYIASHDLQEPLRMIGGFLRLLHERYGPQLDARAQEYIDYSVEGADRMSKLISDLLEYSRAGRGTRQPEPTNAQEALAGALTNLQGTIQEAGATVSHEELPTVKADSTQLMQLFQNLIGNAIKFRRADLPCQVHVSARQEEGRWVFAVRDNGIGIAPGQYERIFIIFQRLHTRDKYPGTGIGLAICKRIIERHGGRIWVESKVGEGSTFHFTLAAV